MFDLFADVAGDHEGHVVVLLLLLLRIRVLLSVIQRHHPDQAEALVLRLLHRVARGRVTAPDAVHDRVIRRRHDDDDDERAPVSSSAEMRSDEPVLTPPVDHTLELQHRAVSQIPASCLQF